MKCLPNFLENYLRKIFVCHKWLSGLAYVSDKSKPQLESDEIRIPVDIVRFKSCTFTRKPLPYIPLVVQRKRFGSNCKTSQPVVEHEPDLEKDSKTNLFWQSLRDCFTIRLLYSTIYLLNKCWPILVQGLQRDFWNMLIIFKHINNNVSLAQLVEC